MDENVSNNRYAVQFLIGHRDTGGPRVHVYDKNKKEPTSYQTTVKQKRTLLVRV
jgi:hypothetical protein